MRKLVLALVATTAIVGQASADVKSGFYVGANASANALLAKGTWSWTHIANPAITIKKHSDLGDFGLGVGAYAGYGAVLANCYYLAGELAYNWNNATANHSLKISDTRLLIGSNANEAISGSAHITIKKQNIFNFAVLAGFKVTPATIMYARLGGNVGKTEVRGSVLGHKHHKSSTNLTFAPGVGMETTFNKNWVARMEYTCDFGTGNSGHHHHHDDSSSSTSTTTAPSSSSSSTSSSSSNDGNRISGKSVNTHSVKLGIAYKF